MSKQGIRAEIIVSGRNGLPKQIIFFHYFLFTSMRFNQLVFSLAFTGILLSSCGKKSDAPGGADSTKKATDSVKTTSATPSTVNAAKFPIKSGIIHGETEAMGMKSTTTKYFDDFGAMEAEESMSTMKMSGITINSHRMKITKNGMIYDIDLEKKTGTQMKIPTQGMGGMDFKNMGEQMMKDMGISQIGNETIAGKECKVMEMKGGSKGMGMTGKVWIWGATALKMDMGNGTMRMKQTTTSIEDNASISADKFEVPKDIVLKEFDMTTKTSKVVPK